MKVGLIQVDGKLPNLALMKLSHWHKQQGDSVFYSDRIHKDIFEPEYDLVYGSSIFKFSEKARTTFKREFTNCFIGGTGTDNLVTVEEMIGEDEYEHYDSGYEFDFLYHIILAPEILSPLITL